MSGEPSSQSESSPQAPKAAKKNRSPLERVIVWGGILVLLLLVAVQAHGRFGYEMSLGNLEPLIDDDREGGEPLPLAEVDSHLVGFPSTSETEIARDRTERVYRWQGLGRSYGITISYNPSVEPVVVTGLVTDAAPPEPEPEPVPDEATDEAMAGAGAGGGGGGGGGFGPPMHDADGSGAGGGGRGEGEARPQRPASETDDQSDTPGDQSDTPDDSPAAASDDEATPDESAADDSGQESTPDSP